MTEPTLFDTWRLPAFFTSTASEQAGTVDAERIHRRHAIIENVHADLKHSALAPAIRPFHCQRGVVGVGAHCCQPHARCRHQHWSALTKATTGTIRRTLINVPTRVSSTANTLTLHLPTRWPWQQGWCLLFTRVCGSPPKWAS